MADSVKPKTSALLDLRNKRDWRGRAKIRAVIIVLEKE
jgi:hypothetical protein